MKSFRAFVACAVAVLVLRYGTQAADETVSPIPLGPQTTYATTHVGSTP